MATTKPIKPTKPARDPQQLEAKLSDLKSDIEYAKLDVTTMLALNKWLVQQINAAQAAARSKAAVDIQPGSRVRFVSRKYGTPIEILVSSVGRTGIVRGAADNGSIWKVSASICTAINPKEKSK